MNSVILESVAISVGRGRGSATNVPERALIEQVRLRPLLYDKNVKDYRKVRKSFEASDCLINLFQSLEHPIQLGLKWQLHWTQQVDTAQIFFEN